MILLSHPFWKMFWLSVCVIGIPGNIFLAGTFLVGFFRFAYAEDTIAPLDSFRQGLNSYQAKFIQTIYTADGEMYERSSGSLYLQIPEKFHWVWEKPYQQRILSDGKSVWFYDIDLEQVIIRDSEEAVKNTPIHNLLVQTEDPFYTVRSLGNIQGSDWVELLPKDIESSAYQRVRIGFDRVNEGYAPLMILLFDNMEGYVTRIDLSERKLNTILPADLFTLNPPETVDVIDERE